MRPPIALPVLAWLALAIAAPAPGQDGGRRTPPPVPPPGIEVPAADRAALEAGLAELQGAIDRVARAEGRDLKKLEALLPDVQVFHKAVRDALRHGEFFDPKDIAKAKRQLEEGKRRAEQLAKGEAPWTSQIGLVVRGYVSRRSTARSSRTGWWSRRPTPRSRRTATGSTSGSTAGARS